MSAEKQTFIKFQPPALEISSKPYKSSLEAIRSRHSQELIIGLCGAIGAGVKRLKTTVINELKQANYHIEHIRLSELIANSQPNSAQILSLEGYERYNTLQNLGDDLRKNNSDTTVAEMGIRRIGLIRNALFGNGTETGTSVKVTKKVAYVVDQIKHRSRAFPRSIPKQFLPYWSTADTK